MEEAYAKIAKYKKEGTTQKSLGGPPWNKHN